MIQAKVIEMIFKAFFKHPKIKELFKYKDEPNELDIAVKKLQEHREEDKIKLNAALDLFKSSVEGVDKFFAKVRSIDKVIDKFDDKLKQIDKMAHPPAIPLKEINEFRETNKNSRWMMGIFNKMKKIPIFKSVFK